MPQSRRLVGRGAELDRLLAVFDAAAAGEQAGVALVGGDAGVGKTRLITELIGRARGRGGMVLAGQCAELRETMPYLPLVEALWSATRDQDTAPAIRSVLRERPALARLLPDNFAEPAGDGELARQQLFGAVLGLLSELADAQPVLLVLEDLHWADHSTRDLLTFLSRVLQRERVCLVGTYRTDDLHRRHPLRPVLAELFRLPSVTSIELRPLPARPMADHLTELAGERLAPEVLDRLIERAGGNAFYAEELLAAATTGEELPAGLAELLLARVERLTETARRVVGVAAVAGARVNDDLVREVSGLDPETYDTALREIVSHQLLVPDGADGYTFRHALLREAVYGDLLPGERTRLHAAFARLLRARGDRPAAELAHHSLASHDIPGAVAASVAAAAEAERLGAPAEAYEHYDRALSLWDAVPDPEALAATDRIRLLLRAAATAAHSGQTRRAMHLLRRVFDGLDPAADATTYAEVGERLAHYTIEADEIGAASAVARAAVDALPAAPPTPLLARALATYVRALLWSDLHADIPEWAERALAAAAATGAIDAETSALVTLGLYHEPADESTRAEEYFERARARALAGRSGDLSIALRAAFHYTRSQFDRGHLSAAARSIVAGVRLAVDSGLAWSTYGIDLRFLEYLIHYTAGDWDRAEALADSFGIRVGTIPEAQVSAYALFIEVARGSDTAAERLSWLEPLWADDPLVTYIARGLAAERALWRGDEPEAIDHVAAVLKALPRGDAGVIRIAATGLRAHAEQAVRARAAGDELTERAAIQAADDLVERARWAAANNSLGPRAWIGVEGRAWLARAEAEWHRAVDDDDPKLWRAVVDAFDYGYPYEVARSRWRLAAALVARGERAEARSEWQRAVEIADRLHAAPLRRALADLARQAGFGDTTRPAQAGPLAALTSREREVLRLVAEGRNNREIAATLFISPKTASVHVSNILAKLDVSSRTQAAAIAHRSGLLADAG
ncbi:MAG TPA: AAA family ATPase [Streptosporangiaceae bacterium]|nr:AAA family ATPase [Streptosporangiaceae bacterium]